MKHILLICAAAIMLGSAVAACSAAGTTSAANQRGAQASPAAPSVSPVSAQATVAGKCVTGIYLVGLSEFYSMSAVVSGSVPSYSGNLAEAYQLTMTDTSSSATAAVTGFAVVFYSGSQELASDSERLTEPTYITPGQSLTWIKYPWGFYQTGDASQGPFAAGVAGAVDSAATCQLLQWSH